ncbi:hypothetical protein [Tetragenococcus halophilus]|uniref:hypothetical protein n=1 Tax=Tetragenococcus halophilus TaxID=51669 RepID=UPI00209ACFB6|nr:hypothetical protein [Tetragenococcus halophilus]MCO8292663.1 hypothetical protein [Tetragenococcus halophilus]
MKSIFKRIFPEEIDCLFEQKAIDDDEQTPEGWVDNIEDLDLPSGDNSDEKDQEKEEQKDS